MALTEEQKAIFTRPTQPKPEPTFTVSQALARKRVQTEMNQNAPKAPEGFFSKFAKGAVGLGKDILGSAASTAIRSQTELSPAIKAIDPSGVLREKILPEKVDLPGGVEVEPRYSPSLIERLKQSGEDLLNVLPGAGPLLKRGATELAERGAKGVAGRFIKSAFRITENDLKKKPTLIKDFLKERISGLTRKGIAKKSDAVVNAMESQLDEVIAEGAKSGRFVEANKVAESTKDLITFYENSIFPEFANVVKSKVDDFVKRGRIPVAEAQEFKKNSYQILRRNYGKLAGPEAETAKQVVRGIKEGLEEALPEFAVADINKKIAIYGKARDLMLRQINVVGRNELIPFKDLVIAGSTGRIWPILARRVIESVPFKTSIANILTSTKTEAIKTGIKSAAPIAKELPKQIVEKPE